jgi:hypothetical protein
MAVGVVLDFEGGTLEQYDQTMELMNFTAGGSVPPGALFHWVTKTDTGLRVTDVWETKEAFDAFAEKEIGPKTAAVGFEGPPTITFYEVHNYLK